MISERALLNLLQVGDDTTTTPNSTTNGVNEDDMKKNVMDLTNAMNTSATTTAGTRARWLASRASSGSGTARSPRGSAQSSAASSTAPPASWACGT